MLKLTKVTEVTKINGFLSNIFFINQNVLQFTCIMPDYNNLPVL